MIRPPPRSTRTDTLCPYTTLFRSVLATGIASAALEAMGKPYIDSNGHHYASMLGQPILVFESDLDGLQAAHREGIKRELAMVPYIHGMFSTGHDEANRQVFLADDANNLELVGLALRGRKKADRTSVVEGKSVSVRVDLGVRRTSNKKK